MRARLALARDRKQGFTARLLERRALQVAALARALNAVSPLATLSRGYAVLIDPIDGHVLRFARDIAPGTVVDARLADGSVRLRREP
jgi:exodeoxyribonuclease VII large subunit